MKQLVWRSAAFADRDEIFAHIEPSDPRAAAELDADFEAHAERALRDPALYKPGRIKGTREIVVRPNYVMVYRVLGGTVEVLRVLHAARQWPASAA